MALHRTQHRIANGNGSQTTRTFYGVSFANLAAAAEKNGEGFFDGLQPDAPWEELVSHDNGIGRNADELMRKVQAAQFIAEHPDEVCPAKWQPGAETLKPGLDLVGKI